MASCQTRSSDLQFFNSAVSETLTGVIHKVHMLGRGGGGRAKRVEVRTWLGLLAKRKDA